MPHQVLFVQGGGTDVHDKWDNLLVDSLAANLGPDYHVLYPSMPDEADPNYGRWKPVLEREFSRLNDGAILVGHSVGATILINTVAASPQHCRLSGIVLLSAPFVGAGGWPSGDIDPIDRLGAALPENVAIHLYHGTADDIAPLAHLHLYAKAIPQAVVHELSGRDHQLNNDLRDIAADIVKLIHT